MRHTVDRRQGKFITTMSALIYDNYICKTDVLTCYCAVKMETLTVWERCIICIRVFYVFAQYVLRSVTLRIAGFLDSVQSPKFWALENTKFPNWVCVRPLRRRWRHLLCWVPQKELISIQRILVLPPSEPFTFYLRFAICMTEVWRQSV
jgi:hypothetical protein